MRRTTGWRVGVPVVAALAGLLFATSATTAHGADLRVIGRSDLADLVARMQRTVNGETKQLAALQQRVRDLTDQAARTDGRVAQLRTAADELAGSVGLRPETGPGLIVTLDDAPPLRGAAANAVPPDYLVVHQQDIQAVVNALWAGGARAISLQGKRLVATSAVRCVGNTLLLEGVVYSPPYVIAAVGDPDRLRAALDADPNVTIYRQYVAAYHLGYQVRTAQHLTVPAYDGSLTLVHAAVLPPQTGGQPPRTPAAPLAGGSSP
ncbi:MAG: DUF881 domain-containing protein [Acidothermus cellulolyticus]|nr:DUF881 domain-containing protein [Acidothermus cellulolyticus]